MNSSKLGKIGIKQLDQTDCGVACVLTILNYFNIKESPDKIRSIVGKTSSGSTLLGLKEGLSSYGVLSEGYEATIEQIQELRFPCILHTVLEKKYFHFVVLFKYENEKFVIHDPAQGLIYLKENELEDIWKSKRLLLIESEPDQNNPLLNVDQNRSTNKSIYSDILLLFKKHQNFLIVAGLLGILVSLMGLSISIFSQILIDNLFVHPDKNRILFALLVVLSILIIRAFLNFARSYLLLIQSKSFNTEIIETFFGKLMFLPLTFFESKNTGDLISRMHDTLRIQSLITTFFGQTIIDFFILGAISLFLIFHSFLIGCLVITTILIFISLSFLLRKKIINYQRKVMSSYALTESVFIDSITGSETIKSYTLENLFTSLIKEVYDKLQINIFDLNIFKAKLSLLLEIAGTFLTLLIFSISINEYMDNMFSLGVLVAILQISLLLQPSLLQIFISNTQIQEAITAFSRMREYTQLNPEVQNISTDRNISITDIQIQGLSFKYPGRNPLFSNLSFSITKGELLLLKGESGSGKTTIFKLLQRFYGLNSGKITLNKNMDISEIDPYLLRNRIGYIPQEIKLFNSSLLFNIALSENVEPEKIISLCQEIEIHDEIQKIPDGYAALIGETGVRLSGGQRQLIGFARALYKKPQILLIDEGTSSMDPELEIKIQSIILRRLPDLIVIVSSHSNRWDSIASKQITLQPIVNC